MLVQYNKFKSLDNLKNDKFLFCIILYFGINISFGIIFFSVYLVFIPNLFYLFIFLW